jgi:hypothetical protein
MSKNIPSVTNGLLRSPRKESPKLQYDTNSTGYGKESKYYSIENIFSG